VSVTTALVFHGCQNITTAHSRQHFPPLNDSSVIYYMNDFRGPTNRYTNTINWKDFYWQMVLGSAQKLVLGLHNCGTYGNMKQLSLEEVTPPRFSNVVGVQRLQGVGYLDDAVDTPALILR